MIQDTFDRRASGGNPTTQSNELVPHLIARLPEVRRRTGLSTSTIYRLETRGKFPSRVQISDRGVGWHLSEVLAWVSERPNVAGNTAAPQHAA